ncbi:hypothetical protein [Oceanobacillus saliphilus]|uniref:hypothetical protein n=1 Tax=Oceanobacillus saliphilus TaxID=2925834 RepID=UPI00201DDDE7|nr:hypothetical protein [Oceanobacillus saliphilus]
MFAYLLAVAAVIAVTGIIIAFKINLDKIKRDPEQMGKAQSNFFIGAAISESIPIIMIVFALINAEPVPMEDLYVPAGIVMIMMVFAAIFIFLQRSVDVEEDQKQAVTSFSFIALGIANAIPLIALVFMFINAA